MSDEPPKHEKGKVKVNEGIREMPMIPAVGRLRQKGLGFKASLT